MKISALHELFLSCKGVSTDTRTLSGGELFFALSGENFDGNAFAIQALEKGASHAVVRDDIGVDDPRLVKVPDTLEALKALARFHREWCGVPVIGLTGTNGKTTTKELIRTVLSTHFKVVATEGNLNNEIGVPLSVLRFTKDTEIGLIEMGASHPDDLVPLLDVARPTLGLITNVGKAHLEGFGSFEGVKHAKGLLYDWLKAHAGVIFSNADDPVLGAMLAERCLGSYKYGVKHQGFTVLPASAEHPFVRIETPSFIISTQLVGAYNASNVLAAMCIGHYFGIPDAEAAAAIGRYEPSNKRSQLVSSAHNTLIVDAYNANPSSMAVALDNLSLTEGRRVALLGDMRELGADSAAEHEAVVRRLGAYDLCYLVGGEFTKAVAACGAPYRCFATSDELAAFLKENPLEGCVVLVKGSRGIRMEKVIDAL